MFKAIPRLLLAGASLVSAALEVDFASPPSIKAAAKDVAFDVMSYYKGNQTGETLGLLDWHYFMYNSALLWSTMIDYWRYTGDDTYNDVTVEGLAAQNGNDTPAGEPFMPFNYSLNIANDEQGFWAMAAMQAVELDFPAAPQGQPSWLELAQGVFDLQAGRWAVEERGLACKGGLSFGIIDPSPQARDFKNTLSSAVFLNLGARLSWYTANQTYANWAEKVWTWLDTTGLIDDESNVFEATDLKSNCTYINKRQWSYAAGVLIEAAAYMYNHTTTPEQQTTWQTRLTTLTNRTLEVFFPNHTLLEPVCEPSPSEACNRDTPIYKGVTLRSLASAAQLAPSLLRDMLEIEFETTARAAVRRCNGAGVDVSVSGTEGSGTGRECAHSWVESDDGRKEDEEGNGDGDTDGDGDGGWKELKGREVGRLQAEMNALSALMGVLVDDLGRRQVGVDEGVRIGSGGGGGATRSGDDENVGAEVRVGVGLLLAGLVAAVL